MSREMRQCERITGKSEIKNDKKLDRNDKNNDKKKKKTREDKNT